VKAARKALAADSWKLLPPTERGNLMLKLADLVDQHKETLATIETWDNGMLLRGTELVTANADFPRQAVPGFPQ
jgi:acyl-CoA reductase-like NAD-dependent aldehyde dehydrogenase